MIPKPLPEPRKLASVVVAEICKVLPEFAELTKKQQLKVLNRAQKKVHDLILRLPSYQPSTGGPTNGQGQ